MRRTEAYQYLHTNVQCVALLGLFSMSMLKCQFKISGMHVLNVLYCFGIPYARSSFSSLIDATRVTDAQNSIYIHD